MLPVLIALAAYWRRGGFEPETGLLNADEAAPAEAPKEIAAAPVESFAWHGLGARFRVAAVALLALGLIALAIPAERFGASPQYRIGEEQARAAADTFLRSRGIDPSAFRHVTFPDTHWGGDDSLAGKYFLEHGSVSTAAALFERNRPVQHWVTRYFKSLDKEEALVSIHPETGKVLGFHHTLPEDRPGADLPEDDARAIAAAFAASLGRNPAAMDLNESRSEKKKARRDYTFVWQARPGDARNVADARFRLEVEVAGDQAASLRSYWHLPETFTRARSQQNFISIPVMTLRFGLLAAGFVAGIWLLLRKIRQGQVPWRTVIRVAIPIALLTAVGPLLSMKLLLQGYNTAIPLETYEATMYLVVAMSVIFGFVMAGAAAALILSYHPEAAAALRAASRRAAGRDALIALLAAAGLVLLSRQAQIVLLDRFHAAALFSVGSPDLIVSVLPALAAVAAAIRSILLYGAALAICALIVEHLRRPWMAAGAALLAPFLLLPLDIRTPAEFALQYTCGFLTVAAAVVFCRYFARANYLAYALVLWLVALRGPLAELFGNPYPAYVMQGRLLALIAAAAILWAVIPSWTGKKQESEAAA